MNIKIAYDADLLIISNININTQRGGIYFVGYNIAKILLNNKYIDLYFYVSKYFVNRAKNILSRIYDTNNIKVISEYSKEWFEINIFYSFYRRPDNFIINNKNIVKYILIHDVTPIIDNMLDWGNEIFTHLDEDYIYFTNSNYSKLDLIKYSNGFVNENRVHVTLLGYDKRFKKKELNDFIRNKYNIPKDKKYVFALCGLHPRKNLVRNIITFFKFINKNNIKDMIFIMGGYHSEDFINTFYDEIKEYKDQIIQLGYVDDEDVPYLYSGAQWFIYTSQYEGFGLPPLEAMACGCPVITSNNTSLPEVVGDAGIMIDWDSDEQHISAYEKYYFDEEYRKEMSKRGLERSKLFSWENCVNSTLNIICNNYNKNQKNTFLIRYDTCMHMKIFKKIFILPKLNQIFSVTKSSDNKFYIINIFFIKISIRRK